MNKLRNYVYNLHDVEVNQKYGEDLPYSFHLKMVEAQYDRFIHLLPSHYDKDRCLAGVISHDVLEDCRITYNDLKKILEDLTDYDWVFAESVADSVYLVTDYKGRSREERKPLKYYTDLAQNDLALFIKLCDMIANRYYSCMTNSSMRKKYEEEFVKFKKLTYNGRYKEMFDLLESLK